MSQQAAHGNNSAFYRMAQGKGINDINDIKDAPPQLQYEICKLTVENIHGILLDNPELAIAEQSLDDFVNSLLQISNVLYKLHIGELGAKYPFKQLRESIDDAKLYLGAALSIFKNDDRIFERGQFIKNSKYKLEAALEIWEDKPAIT